MGLREADPGSELRIRTDVTVKVPLLGGRIEESVGEQILKLWPRRRRSRSTG